jgi:DnaJ-domain-containing protein 1
MRVLPVVLGGAASAALGASLAGREGALVAAAVGALTVARSKLAQTRRRDPRVAGVDLGELRDIPVTLRCEYHESGVRLNFEFPRSLRQDAILEVRLWDRRRARWVPGREPWEGEIGIRRKAKVVLGMAAVYFPFEALVYDRAGAFDVYLGFFYEGPLGEERLFDQRDPCELMLGLPAKGASWSYARHLRPLVDLLMAMARSDGAPSPEKTGAVVRVLQRFEPSTELFAELRAFMRAEAPRPYELTAREVRFAFPEFTLGQIFEWLTEIAKADGAVTTRGQELLELFASACNVPRLELDDWLTSLDARAPAPKRPTEPPPAQGPRPSTDRWSTRPRAAPPRSSATLPVAPPAPRPKTPWEVLEVPENATEDEVQSAYRKKVAQYHPDRVAHLPSEFQELAHQKLLELNAARDRLKRLA